MYRTSVSILAAVALFTGVARSQRLLYRTGFETPNYVAGNSLEGVEDWFSFISPNAVEVVHSHRTASRGRSALRCRGGSPNLQRVPGLLDGAWAKPASVNPAYGNKVIVHVSCDVRLDGPDTGKGPQNDLLSANLWARNGFGGSAYMYLSSVGEVFCFADSVKGSTYYAFATPVALGKYNKLGITLNYLTHMATFWVNRIPVGSAPFGGQEDEAFAGAIFEFAAYDDPKVIDPSLYTGYWDNLTMFAIPL